MSNYLSPSELLEMAITIEENGARFYRHAARQVDDATVAALCNHLADEEDEHKRRFEEVYGAHGIPLDLYDGNLEAHAYLRSLASSQVYGADISVDISSVVSLLRSAIALEKDSLLYYQQLHEGMSEAGRLVLDEILAEERAHVVELNGQLQRIEGGKGPA